MKHSLIVKTFLMAWVCCSGVLVKAQDTLKITQLDDVVITGNKVETTIEKSGKTIYKLNRQQIESNRGKDITDLLNEIPGVQIDGNFATPGTDIGYRIRGAQSEQTLILIDGMPVTDPSALQQTYDLRLLDLSQVESIEVLKGGLSSLYGTGAAAGVINIKLKEPSKEQVAVNANAEYGSFNTMSTNVNISGTSGDVHYMVGGSHRSSDGFSAAKDTLGDQDFDNDGSQNLSLMGKFGYHVSDQFTIGLAGSYDQVKSGYDGGAFSDNDSELELNLWRLSLSSIYKWGQGSFRTNLSYHANERIFDSPGFSDPSVRSVSEFNGNAVQADVIVDQNLSDQFKLIGGVNLQRPVWEPEDASNEAITMIDPYASLIFDANILNVQVGGRLNHHNLYGSNFVWNVNPSFLFDMGDSKLKVLWSYATSYRTPSLSELYSGDFGFLATPAGNPDLKPQESGSAEGGFEWIYDKKFQFSGTYFYRNDKNAIVYESTADFSDGGYMNLDGNTRVSGAEFNGSFSILPQLTFSGHYTYTKLLTKDAILRRVPKEKFGFVLTAIPVEKMLVKVTHLHVGETSENADVTLDAYDLFDGFVSYTLGDGWVISGGINNIFDADYVDRYGWATAGRNYNVGLRYQL